MKYKFVSRLLTVFMALSLIGFVPNSVKAEGVLSDYGKCDGKVTASTTDGGGANEWYQEYNLIIKNSSSETVNDWVAVVKTPENINSLSNETASWNALNYYYSGNTIYVYPVKDKSIAPGASHEYIKLGYSGKAYTSIDVYYSSTAGAFDKFKESGSGSGSGSGETEVINTDVEFNYAKLLQESLYFYDANMCGGNVTKRSAFSWRDNCHTSDSVTIDGQKIDVSGGFHDAGDHVKFGLPQGYTATLLGISYMEFKDAFVETKSDKHYKVIADHFAEYFKKCTVLNKDGSVKCFIYQVGEGNSDHGYWGAPEKQTTDRPVYYTSASNPATDQVSEAIAALTLHYINFGDKASLDCAKKLFDYEKGLNKAVETNGAASFYKSTNWTDDYCLAAALLYKATKDASYNTEFNKYFNANDSYYMSWDGVGVLAEYYGKGDASCLLRCANSMKTTDNGYCCVNMWGSARLNCNVQFLGLLYDKAASKNTYGTWATNQMNYLLGNNKVNSKGQCFVVGYNDLSSKYPHHRAASSSNNAGTISNDHHILLGALVGGPTDANGTYQDKQDDYTANEVALDYNAGFVGAAAALYMLHKNDSNVPKTFMTTADVKNVELRFNYGLGQEPSTEESTTEEPSTEESSTQQPSSEETKTEEPKTEQPSSEQAKTEESSTEQSKTEESSTQQPSSESPSVENNTTEEQKNTEQNISSESTEQGSTEQENTSSTVTTTDNKKPASGSNPDSKKPETNTTTNTNSNTSSTTESKSDGSSTEKTEAGVGTFSKDGAILTDTQGKAYYVIEKVTTSQLKKNLEVADKKSGGKYKVTKVLKKKGKTIGGTVTYMAPYNKNTSAMTAPKAIKIAGVKFKVTAISNNAFKNCKNLTTATIETNVTQIGSNAFRGCPKLKTINIRTKNLKKIGTKAFKGINGKATFNVPKGKLKKYTKLLKQAKAPKKAKIK